MFKIQITNKVPYYPIIMAEEYDFGERTNAEVLLSYANFRGKFNRASGKIDTSMALLSVSFSPQTAKNI